MGELLQGVGEVAGGEHARAESEDVAAHVADDAVDLADELLDAIGETRITDDRSGPLQSDTDREQRLDDAVVQVARDSLPILDHPETRYL